MHSLKTTKVVVGILLILGGVVFFFQGIGVLPGSFMTGETFWAVAGFLGTIAGLALVRSPRRNESPGGAAVYPPTEENRSKPED